VVHVAVTVDDCSDCSERRHRKITALGAVPKHLDFLSPARASRFTHFLEGPSLTHGFESIASKGDGFRAGGYRVLYKNAAKNPVLWAKRCVLPPETGDF
jgi:hypothetical protein